METREIARVAHEVNKAYCEALGDYSQHSWEDAPQWQKESAINGVLFHLENPDIPVSTTHENWMSVKIAEGWVWGPEKDSDKKTHPCLVSFDKLPVFQQVKDHIFSAIVRELLKL